MTLHDSALSLADAAAATHVLELESCAEPNVVMLTDKKAPCQACRSAADSRPLTPAPTLLDYQPLKLCREAEGSALRRHCAIRRTVAAPLGFTYREITYLEYHRPRLRYLIRG